MPRAQKKRESNEKRKCGTSWPRCCQIRTYYSKRGKGKRGTWIAQDEIKGSNFQRREPKKGKERAGAVLQTTLWGIQGDDKLQPGKQTSLGRKSTYTRKGKTKRSKLKGEGKTKGPDTDTEKKEAKVQA